MIKLLAVHLVTRGRSVADGAAQDTARTRSERGSPHSDHAWTTASAEEERGEEVKTLTTTHRLVTTTNYHPHETKPH